MNWKELDSVIPYPTPKIARIKDGKLGLLRYAFMFIIFLYVVVYQIMWRGAHLESKDLSAVHQLQLDHPTKNHCNSIDVNCEQNFSAMKSLPYCSQSNLSNDIKLPCQFWDAPELTQVTDEGLMIPTHVQQFLQRPGCKLSALNNWTCVGWLKDFVDKKGSVQLKRGKAKPISNIFIADVERFTLLIDHSVRSVLGHRDYASEMEGYWLDCSRRQESDASCIPRPILCGGSKHCAGNVKQLRYRSQVRERPRGARRSLLFMSKPSVAQHQMGPDPASDETLEDTRSEDEIEDSLSEDDFDAPNAHYRRQAALDEHGVVSDANGDTFLVGKLLKIANVPLDRKRHHVPAWVGGSYRSSGFVLVMRIHYTNREAWLGLKALPWDMLGPKAHYTYRITKHASHDDYMISKVQWRPKSHLRELREFYGIRILLEQSGSIECWGNVQLLLILTTTLALMTVANFITDTIALNCMPRSEEYHAIKFERPIKRHRPKDAGTADTDGAGETVTEAEDNIQRFSSITM